MTRQQEIEVMETLQAAIRPAIKAALELKWAMEDLAIEKQIGNDASKISQKEAKALRAGSATTVEAKATLKTITKLRKGLAEQVEG